MNTTKLPPTAEMYRAFVDRDSSYDGIFFTGVRTTRIFCRPICPARKPNPANVEFFHDAKGAMLAGFRPCLRCRPLEPGGKEPEWIQPLFERLDTRPEERLRDQDLKVMRLDPVRVRRWFRSNLGMTFHAYQRSMRLGKALGTINEGNGIGSAAYRTGYESESGFRAAFVKLFGEPPGRARDAHVLRAMNLATPLGPMLAVASEAELYLLEFADRRMLATQIKRLRCLTSRPVAPGANDLIRQLESELNEYFRGERRDFDVPLRISGTDFQTAVWRQLLQIPPGETRSYDDIARAVGNAGAARAVGRANGDNRIAILIPCHRVIRSDGTLSGYGGGVWRKKRLLDLEARSAVPA